MSTIHGIGLAAALAFVVSAAPAQGEAQGPAKPGPAKQGANNEAVKPATQGKATQGTGTQGTGTQGTFGFDQAGALPAQPKSAKKPEQAPSAKAKPAADAPGGGSWVLLEATKEVTLRDFQSINGNRVAGPFPAGTLFLERAGDQGAHGFRHVSMPGGFPGYIFAKYVRETDQGTGIVSGSRVSFRYRPRPKNGEAPVDQVANGLEVKLLERSGDWWRVLSSPEVRAWIAADAVREVTKVDATPDKITDALDAKTKARFETQLATQMQAWTDARAKLAAAHEREEAVKSIQVLIDDAVALMNEESKKAFAKQSWDPIGKLYATIEKQLDAKGIADGPARERYAQAKAEYRRRELLCGIKTAKALPKPANAEVKPAVAEAEPKRFEYSGWLQYRPGPNDYSPFQLYKGGQRLYFVVCDSGRYDLSDYRGFELGIRGTVERREGATIRVLNIEKLLVIGRN